ncbi:hypothetical protein [Thiomonas bhubaneswarensis]|uniref:hypothetical protein n=1 Tax=Thiomonas bhubaneswarensis TaxID=339866 RepID=UPI0006E23774|nr:hypothetical protein [Thiomonas bhubaneswarensis]
MTQAADEACRLAIEREAQDLRRSPGVSISDAAEWPALRDLLRSARVAIAESIPATFEHEGATYRLTVIPWRLGVRVFGLSGDGEPLFQSVVNSSAELGHQSDA